MRAGSSPPAITTRAGATSGCSLGTGLALWLVWFLSTLAGYLRRRSRAGAEALRPRPRHAGLLRAMLVPLWKGARPALPWLAAGLVAVIVHALVPGYCFIIAGALAGVATGC